MIRREGENMAIPSAPYHSTNPTDPDVYHVFSDCPNGEQIPPENWASGANNWDLCGSCKNMGGKPV
jgi:hypothetical protein